MPAAALYDAALHSREAGMRLHDESAALQDARDRRLARQGRWVRPGWLPWRDIPRHLVGLLPDDQLQGTPRLL